VTATTNCKKESMDGSVTELLQALAKGDATLPHTSARRHHFVPAFALAQFARPAGSRTGWLFQLDTGSGTPQRTRPQDAAFVKDLHTYEDRKGDLSHSVEAFFSLIETRAAPALAQLRDDAAALSPDDRETIAFFLALQESRTPGGLIRSERSRQAWFELKASMDLSTTKAFRRAFASDYVDALATAEAEEMRGRMQDQLLEGRVVYETPRAGALAHVLSVAAEIAAEIYDLDWTVLTAEGAEFVTSDRPISMRDTSPEYPWSGNAWRSSPLAINFYPLSPTKGLFITSGAECGLGYASSNADQVKALNLMTYGWADRFIYGSTQEVVCRVRREARSNPSEVATPRPVKQVLLAPPDVLDPSIRADYAQRGWPTGFLVTGDDGQPQVMSYLVVDLDQPAGAMARLAKTLADRFGSAA
jgi:hypothetical protein